MLKKESVHTGGFNLDLKAIYGNDGRLGEVLEDFTERPQQKKMAAAVSEALAGGDNLLVEAGTGTGKSLAYLIPSARFALETESPVVISTNTINLQEQLEDSDLPLTRSVLDDDLETVLVKGRQNYVCTSRLQKAWEERHLRFADARKERQLQQLLEWSRQTEDGSRSDIDFEVHGDVWSQVCSKRGICKCLNRGDTDCFYARSRQDLQEADILLVNHHLLLQDLSLRMDSGFGVLPRYGAVVLDEAQHLEHVARQCLGLEISYLQFKYLRRDLFHPDKETGLLTVVGAEDLSEKVERLEREVESFFNDVRAYHADRADDRFSTLRVYESHIVNNSLDPVLSDLLRGLRDHHERSNLEDEDQDELKAMINRITRMKEGLDHFLQQQREDDVYWIERSEYRDNVTLRSSPVDVSDLMRENLFDPIHTAVLTSATLTTTTGDEPFDYVGERLGLDSARTLQLGHPFDYRHQVTLRMVSDLTSPSDNSREFRREVGDWLENRFESDPGRTFVLFTSYRMLNNVADRIEPTLEKKGGKLLVQGGNLPRQKMLEEFRNNQPAVIFGADAFWEGVDVRGDDLSHVVITKLPFPNPSDPLVEATSERLEKEGKQPFTEYFIPEAVLSLKQGFGRLIRSHSDTGEITILDSRVLTKPYGHFFRDALPDCETIHEQAKDGTIPS